MTCKEANNLSIENLLLSWGYQKLKSHKGGDEFFWENPIRTENESSFLVNIKKNVWVDFGIIPPPNKDGVGGKVVDLIMHRENTDVKGALAWLRENTNNFRNNKMNSHFISKPYVAPEPRFTFKSSKQIFSYLLKDYLKERHIDLNIAKEHVQEIRFNDSKSKSNNGLVSLGIKNISGGYAMRNKLGHCVLDPHDITYIPTNSSTDTLIIFEGMFDFLSYLMIKKSAILNDDVILLNTLTHVRRASKHIEKLPHIRKVISFLDNPNQDKPDSIKNMNVALEILKNLPVDFYTANSNFIEFEDVSHYWQSTGNQNPFIFTKFA